MKTVVEPQQHIAALWSKPLDRDGLTFRLMRYIMQVDHEGKVLLHNVVTGQLVLLDDNEKKLLDNLPGKYSLAMNQLIDDHYLVAEHFDEHQQVVNMRTILRKLANVQPKHYIRQYIIFPTTACNARCYYCFEQGTKTVTMTKDTADEVVEFITNNCGEDKKASIMWFGGEPTVASIRIDQISAGLKRKGVTFTSTMISNAYLFDEEMVIKARDLWNLKRIQISVDGLEDNYNKVKDFVNARNNPFQRVMHNIEMLLEYGIHVDLRMNYDLGNYMDFYGLLEYVKNHFKSTSNLQFYAYPVIGDYPDKNGKHCHGSDEWREGKTVELNNLVRAIGIYRPKRELPHLHYHGCGADDDNAITINADGLLVKCPEHFDETDSIGNLREGIVNNDLVQGWKQIADYDICRECVFFPRCIKLLKCSAKDKCYYQDRNQQFYKAVIQYSVTDGIQ